MEQDNDNKHYYSVLQRLSMKLQRRVADIIKYLDFSVHDTLLNLDEAIKHYQTHNNLNKKSPAKFLSMVEYRLVFEDKSFDVSLYKAILFIRVADAIKSGANSLDQSYKYMPINSYLIDKEKWRSICQIVDDKGLTALEDYTHSRMIPQTLLDRAGNLAEAILSENFETLLVSRRARRSLREYEKAYRDYRDFIQVPFWDWKSEGVDAVREQYWYLDKEYFQNRDLDYVQHVELACQTVDRMKAAFRKAHDVIHRI